MLVSVTCFSKQGANLDLNFNYLLQDQNFKSLIHLGVHGHYPLFDKQWVNELVADPISQLSKKQQIRAKELFKKVLKHRNIERKKILVQNFQMADRKLVIKIFLDMVEDLILNGKTEIQ